MKRIVLALALLCSMVSLATADGQYTYRDGYYYLGNQAYTQVRYWQPGYYTWSSCRCYQTWVPGYYFYKYVPYYAPTTYTAPAVNYNGNWRSELAALATQIDKREGELAKMALDQQFYMQAVQALGLQRRGASYPGYGVAYGSALYGAVPPYGANASTQYGYTAQSFNTIAQVYGNADLNTLFQQAQQLTSNAQRLSGEANTGFQQLVGQEGGNRARVAEILAKGQMAQQVLNALAAAPSAEVRGYSFKVSQGKIERVTDDKVVTDDQRAKLRKDFEALAQAKCLACHNDKEAKGGFKIADYYNLTVADKNKVWEVITTPDDKLLMPRKADGSAGPRLQPNELYLFFVN